MSKKMFTSLILVLAFAMVFPFGVYTASAMGPGYQRNIDRDSASFHNTPRGVDRDLGILQDFQSTGSMFGLDRAYSSAGRAEYDADHAAYNFEPETYGLMGNFWINQSND